MELLMLSGVPDILPAAAFRRVAKRTLAARSRSCVGVEPWWMECKFIWIMVMSSSKPMYEFIAVLGR